jgi:hypothetical protein
MADDLVSFTAGRVINFELTQSEGEVARLVVDTEPAAGWASGMHTLHADGLTAKGILVAVPSGLQGRRVKLEFECRSANFEEQLKAYADTLRVAPYYDELFFGGKKKPLDGEDDDRDPAEVLEARSAVFWVDPATHAIQLSDVIAEPAGFDFYDVGPYYDQASFQFMPVDTVVNSASMDLSVEWDQQASGQVNIASRFPNEYTFTPPGTEGVSEMGGSSGWSVDDFLWGSASGETFTTYYTGEVEDREYVITDASGGTVSAQTLHVPIKAPLRTYSLVCYEAWARYDYSQARREIVRLKAVSNVWPAFGESVRHDRLSNISLSSVTDDPVTPLWKPNTEYEAGDVVQIGGKVYKALVSHTSGEQFVEDSEDTTAVRYELVGHGRLSFYRTIMTGDPSQTLWKESPGLSQAPLKDARSYSFFDTTRGEQAVAHAALRLRAYLRKRMRAFTITFRGTWEMLADITLDDSVRINHWSLPGGAAIGKVVSYRKVWKGEDPNRTRYVEVTLGVSAGAPYMGSPPVEVTGAYTLAFAGGYANGDGSRAVAAGEGSVVIDPTEIEKPVDVYRLDDPDYVVTSFHVHNEFPWQTATASRADALLIDAIRQKASPLPPNAAEAVSEIPLEYHYTMRDLRSGGVLERVIGTREYPVFAQAGLDLSGGGF